MRIVFCDDELDSISRMIEVIKGYMESVTDNLTIDLYDDPEKMINDIKKYGVYDLHFIDIEMQIKGNVVVRKIREIDRYAVCIFLSYHFGYGNMACRSRLNAYLYKDMDEKEITYEMRHVMESYRLLHQCFEFFANGEYMIFRISEIECFEAIKRRVMLRTVDGDAYEISQYTLASIENLSEFYSFFRLARSLLVNVRGIKYVGRHTLEFKSGLTMRISKAQFIKISQQLDKMIDMGMV